MTRSKIVSVVLLLLALTAMHSARVASFHWNADTSAYRLERQQAEREFAFLALTADAEETLQPAAPDDGDDAVLPLVAWVPALFRPGLAALSNGIRHGSSPDHAYRATAPPREI